MAVDGIHQILFTLDSFCLRPPLFVATLQRYFEYSGHGNQDLEIRTFKDQFGPLVLIRIKSWIQDPIASPEFFEFCKLWSLDYIYMRSRCMISDYLTILPCDQLIIDHIWLVSISCDFDISWSPPDHNHSRINVIALWYLSMLSFVGYRHCVVMVHIVIESAVWLYLMGYSNVNDLRYIAR